MRVPQEGFRSTVISMTVTSPVDAEIVGASLPGAREVALNAMVREGSLVEVRRVAKIDLPAATDVRLRMGPGEHHLMAMHLRDRPVPGHTVRARLQLRDVSSGRRWSIDVPVAVLPPRGGGHGGAHGGEHDDH